MDNSIPMGYFIVNPFSPHSHAGTYFKEQSHSQFCRELMEDYHDCIKGMVKIKRKSKRNPVGNSGQQELFNLTR